MSQADSAPEIAPEWQALLYAHGWRRLDDLFTIPNDASLAKASLPAWRERLRCVLPDPASGERVVFLKRFQSVPAVEQVRRWLSGDPNHGTAWTEWTWLRRLARAGVPVPAAVAYGERMLGPWERRSAVVMSEVPGTSLERWCAQNRLVLPEPVRRELARTVSRFHSLGVVHRDLYLSHVFCDDPLAADPRVSLIDLQRVRRVGWRRRRWIVKDLASLNYSTPAWAATPHDRLRWLKCYLGVQRLDRPQRVLARLIAAKTQRIRRRDRETNGAALPSQT